MAKAVLDLPDTHDSTEGSQSGGDVDDLLAQMAGEEIDRLLSEADDPREAGTRRAQEPAPAAAVVAPPKVPAAPPGTDPMAVQLDELYAELEGDPDQPVNQAELPRPGPTTAPFTNDPEALAATSVDAAQAPAAVADAPPLPTESTGHAVVAESETSTAERSALDQPLALSDAGHDDDLLEPPDAPLPFYLKPLAWLSAPLEACSAPTRDLIGKLAVATLLNAAAVLAYVLISRRHH